VPCSAVEAWRKKEVSNPTPLLEARSAFEAGPAPSRFFFQSTWGSAPNPAAPRGQDPRAAAFVGPAACEEERGLEPHTPREVRSAFKAAPAPPPISLPVFVCRRGAWDWNRTNYARLFRPALYQMSYPSRVMALGARGRQRTRTSHGRPRESHSKRSPPLADLPSVESVTCHGQDGRIRTCGLQSPRLALLPG
jgi:hypothetical protein